MDYAISRRRMVDKLIAGRGLDDPRLLEAFRETPRHLFVEEGLAPKAYSDNSLPIGEGQTISQPWVVARMISLAAPAAGDRVLEIGAGSGYQTAVLSRLAGQVYAIERHASLARRAQKLLRSLERENVHVKVFDGTYGWSEFAPYQAILVAAGSPGVPDTLKDQLAEGGRLVIPIGDEQSQRLRLVVRRGDGFEEEQLDDVSFVKLVGRFGWAENASPASSGGAGEGGSLVPPRPPGGRGPRAPSRSPGSR